MKFVLVTQSWHQDNVTNINVWVKNDDIIEVDIQVIEKF